MARAPVTPNQYIDPWPAVNPVMPSRPGGNAFTVGAGAGAAASGPIPNLPGVGGSRVPVGSASIYDMCRFATLNGSKAFSIGTASSTPILDQSPSYRNFLHLRNASGTGGANLYVNFGDVAIADGTGIAGSGFRLEPNEQLLFDSVVPQDDLYAIADAAGGLLVVSWSVIAVTP